MHANILYINIIKKGIVIIQWINSCQIYSTGLMLIVCVHVMRVRCYYMYM